MDPTELSEVTDLEKRATEAIETGILLSLTELDMVPSVELPPYQVIFKIQSLWLDYGLLNRSILEKLTREVAEKGRIALGDALQNVYVEHKKLGIEDVSLRHSELTKSPVQFIIFSEVSNISPYFALYWKEMKRHHLVDDFYSFSGISAPTDRIDKGWGMGLVNMVHRSQVCGFYKSVNDTLRTHIVL